MYSIDGWTTGRVPRYLGSPWWIVGPTVHCTEQAAGENRDGTGFYIDHSDKKEQKFR